MFPRRKERDTCAYNSPEIAALLPSCRQIVMTSCGINRAAQRDRCASKVHLSTMNIPTAMLTSIWMQIEHNG